MSVFGEILALVGSPVPFQYTPVHRELFAPTAQDVERILFYSTLAVAPPRSAIRLQWDAEWAEKIRGLSATHVNAIERRGLSLRYEMPAEGSVEWRRIVHGYTEAEYDEMDRVGLLLWEESYKANEERARPFQEAFLALSFEEQVKCARWYRNAAAWGVLEGFLSEEDKLGIHSEVDYLNREEDEMDRHEHEWDD